VKPAANRLKVPGLSLSPHNSSMQPVELPSSSESLITVTKEHEHVWVIEMHNGADNRLTEPMCEALAAALDLVEVQWRDRWRKAYHDKNDAEKIDGHGALIIVANRKQQKFFSNGFEYPTLLKRPHFIPSMFPLHCLFTMYI
jgi:Delta3-Delta2-enoyl-CoA isomerase